MKKIVRMLIGLLATGFFSVLIARHLDIDEIKGAFSDTDIGLIIVALATFLLGYALRIQRWKVMLSQENPNLTWTRCAGPFFASIAANNVLPFRAGDALRIVGFNKRLGISYTLSFTSLFFERLLDLLVIFLLLGAGLLYFKVDTSSLLGFGGSLLIVTGAFVALVLIFPHTFQRPAYAFANLLGHLSKNLSNKVRELLYSLFSTLQYLSKRSVVANLMILSAASWIIEALVFWLTALAMPTLTNQLASLLATSIGTLSTIIPSSPGYVGTFDYFTAKTMTLLGNPVNAAAAYAFTVHIVLWLPSTIIGGCYLLLHPTKTSKATQ